MLEISDLNFQEILLLSISDKDWSVRTEFLPIESERKATTRNRNLQKVRPFSSIFRSRSKQSNSFLNDSKWNMSFILQSRRASCHGYFMARSRFVRMSGSVWTFRVISSLHYSLIERLNPSQSLYPRWSVSCFDNDASFWTQWLRVRGRWDQAIIQHESQWDLVRRNSEFSVCSEMAARITWLAPQSGPYPVLFLSKHLDSQIGWLACFQIRWMHLPDLFEIWMHCIFARGSSWLTTNVPSESMVISPRILSVSRRSLPLCQFIKPDFFTFCIQSLF
jgi:hypothetical protein